MMSEKRTPEVLRKHFFKIPYDLAKVEVDQLKQRLCDEWNL